LLLALGELIGLAAKIYSRMRKVNYHLNCLEYCNMMQTCSLTLEELIGLAVKIYSRMRKVDYQLNCLSISI
jgi:hypothetical protein